MRKNAQELGEVERMSREEKEKLALELIKQLTPEQLAIAIAEALRAGEKESA